MWHKCLVNDGGIYVTPYFKALKYLCGDWNYNGNNVALFYVAGNVIYILFCKSAIKKAVRIDVKPSFKKLKYLCQDWNWIGNKVVLFCFGGFKYLYWNKE